MSHFEEDCQTSGLVLPVGHNRMAHTRGWHSKIDESALVDAILDRIVHSSYMITIEGMDSMRKRKGLIN